MKPRSWSMEHSFPTTPGDRRTIFIECDWRTVECGYVMIGVIKIGEQRWMHESRVFDEPPTREQIREFGAYVEQMKLGPPHDPARPRVYA